TTLADRAPVLLPVDEDDAGDPATPPADRPSVAGATDGGAGDVDEPAGPDDVDDAAAERARIREWAADNGIEVSPRGKIPTAVVEQYRAAAAAKAEVGRDG
ncbi:histone-like nucleoid-structuring protein Lsr2, partial [Micromonospora sp. NPDC047465]|uniref:Lsr2 family DNA-binding protein n=1 Tax=Micromonospora sp. NPDC047465 TaxID=3154813 RepID=UPI00340F686D